MAKNFIVSTLSNTQHYTNYATPPHGGQPTEISKVTIKGGANLATKALVTPHGVITEVTDQQLETLKANCVFRDHQKSGHITIRTSKVDPEKAVAAGMEAKDGSAPITPKSLKELNLKAKEESASGNMVE